VGVVLLLGASAANADVPASLKGSCTVRTPAPGYSYKFCNDGTPPVSGRTPNVGAVNAVPVPAKYDGYEGLPAKSVDAATMAGADANGDVALDLDVSMPTTPPPPGGYPLIAFMHGCCNGTKVSWESLSFDAAGEQWHNNNAWFAARGYVVLNYTARGFKSGGRGSTGETQLDSRRFEINDFQYLAGLVADDSFFSVNPQKMVATGGSYGGGFAWLALTDPKWKSPARQDMGLVVSAPRYGWTDLVYSLIPNGFHSQKPGNLPAFDGSDSVTPFGIPKQSIVNILFATGLAGSTFPSYITDAFACLAGPEPYETSALCQDPINNTLPSFIDDRSAYYQNDWFSKIASDPSFRIPVFNAGTLTDPLFTAVENLRMTNRIQQVVPDYPIQQYYGDYEHFVQNKAREWGDICGADHHVCNFADYSGGDLNATPAGLVRTGVTTRMNRFIDHYAQPSGNPSQPAPDFDVTASLQVCPQNGSATQPANEPGDAFTAGRFSALAPYNLRIDLSGTQTTTNVAGSFHSTQADPIFNLFTNGMRCPFYNSATSPAGPGTAVYESEPLAERATMIGSTTVSIDYTATATPGLQLNSRLYDVLPDGTAVMVDRGPRRVTSLQGTVTYELHGNGWRFPAGHRVRIEIAQDDGPYVRTSSLPSSTTITGVRLRVPVREPQRGDFQNTSQFCKAQRDFMGEDEFAEKYGTNKNKANAHGKCVSSNK
jgi:X-Pro dipeptidyl-peptidase-like protein/prolyl oligopeptidase family protein